MPLTTKLEAINSMRAALNDPPVSSLSSPDPETAMAISVLDEVSRDTQAKGWQFNTDFDWEFTPDGSKQITIPNSTNILSIEINRDQYPDSRPIARYSTTGVQLYNTVKHSFSFDEQKIEVKRVVSLLDYEQLPETARKFIRIRATRLFAFKALGTMDIAGLTARDEMEAWADLNASEMADAQPNMLKSSHVFGIVRR